MSIIKGDILDQLTRKGWAVQQRCLHSEEAENLAAAQPVWLNIWKTPREPQVFGLLKGPRIWSWMLAKVDSSIVSGETHSPAGSGGRRQPCFFFAPLYICVASWKVLPTLGEGFSLSEPFLEMSTRLIQRCAFELIPEPIYSAVKMNIMSHNTPPPTLDLMPSWCHLSCRDGVALKELVTCSFNVWPPNTSFKKIQLPISFLIKYLSLSITL